MPRKNSLASLKSLSGEPNKTLGSIVPYKTFRQIKRKLITLESKDNLFHLIHGHDSASQPSFAPSKIKFLLGHSLREPNDIM